MAKYSVTIPIAGHVVVEVEASNDEEAIDRAIERNLTMDDIEEWETLRSFYEGNLCHCPRPWEAEATRID